MKKILITGGAGFIGSNLANRLLERGYTVTVLDNLSPQIHGEDPEVTSSLYQSIMGKVNFINGSVTDRVQMERALQGQEAIVHFAAETGTGQSMYEIYRYNDVNVSGTALMLDVLANTSNKVEKFIIASSRAIYGEGRYKSQSLGYVYPSHRSDEDMKNGNFEVKYQGSSDLELVATDELSKIHPSSVYGITKQVQEQLVMTVCPTIGISPVAFRYQNVYGPGQSLKNPYTGILSIFSSLILNKKEINIFEDGKESRDFVFVDDVVSATIKGLELKEGNNQVFNVGTGVPTDVLTVAKTLIEMYDLEVPLKISGNYRLGDIRHNFADLEKIQSLLDFSPKFDFKMGIKLFTDWVKTQHIESSEYEQSIKELKAKGLYK